ncbi:MAG: hypothetical protein Kow0027_30500 [Saprospiraceae bacterium]
MTIEVEKIKAKKAASGCVEVRSVHCTVVKKKSPGDAGLSILSSVSEQQSGSPFTVDRKSKSRKKSCSDDGSLSSI